MIKHKYKILKNRLSISFLVLGSVFFNLQSETVIDFSKLRTSSDQNMSPIIKDALEKAPKKNLKLIFPKSKYFFKPEGAFKKEHSITNHDNGIKNIAFYFDQFNKVIIEGNGSEFLFEGDIIPFILENSEKITLNDISIDWTIPFFVQGKITNVDKDKQFYDIKMFTEGFEFKIENNKLKFPLNSNFSYSSVGESLVFDPVTKAPVYNSNSLDFHRKKEDIKVIELPNGDLRCIEPVRIHPPIGSIITFKGPMGENRYGPAIHAIRSKDISVNNTNVYHALGMGFLGEFAENVKLNKFNVCLRDGTDRIISATADATHFCNCKGEIIIDGSLFENMLDDGTNVHGTYVKIEKILNKNKVKASLQHFQQAGFNFAQKGDQVWIITTPNPSRGNVNKISDFKVLNDMSAEITFSKPLPENIKSGDLIENKTWNADSFVMKNCTIRSHRARNIVLKTPNKALIENNYLNSMMASILLRGEAFHWYESGANENITIRNNKFVDCMIGGGKEQAILFISPRLNNDFDKSMLFDKNIVFENNSISTFDNQIIKAKSVDGLIIRNNIIEQTNTHKPFSINCSLIELSNCKDVQIGGNEYKGNYKDLFKADEFVRKTLKIQNNNGFID